MHSTFRLFCRAHILKTFHSGIQPCATPHVSDSQTDRASPACCSCRVPQGGRGKPMLCMCCCNLRRQWFKTWQCKWLRLLLSAPWQKPGQVAMVRLSFTYSDLPSVQRMNVFLFGYQFVSVFFSFFPFLFCFSTLFWSLCAVNDLLLLLLGCLMSRTHSSPTGLHSKLARHAHAHLDRIPFLHVSTTT